MNDGDLSNFPELCQLPLYCLSVPTQPPVLCFVILGGPCKHCSSICWYRIKCCPRRVLEGCWRTKMLLVSCFWIFLPLFLLLGLILMQVSGPPQWVVPVVSASTAASFWQGSQAPSRRNTNKPHWCPDGQLSSAFPCRSFSGSSTRIVRKCSPQPGTWFIACQT